jgi:23S rRNA pseudouridine1911/1915/1917 synthase
MIQTARKGDWLELITPFEWDGLTVEQIAKASIGIPKKLLHELRIDKGIRLSGHAVPWNTIVKKNERLFLRCFKEEEYGVIPEDLGIKVLYEDDHLLIANKPIMMDTHPNEKDQTGTLANGIAYHYQLLGIQTKVRHIHRLDRDTSGAILFANHPLAGALLDQALEKREIKRTYVAFVHGVISKQKGTIDTAIGRDRHHPTRRRVSASGQKAITHYEVVKAYPHLDITKINLQLDTGRTHQIRVHMSAIGHPLIGDLLYGGKHSLIHHQALHAASLSFHHPITKEVVMVDAPLPSELQQLEQKLR